MWLLDFIGETGSKSKLCNALNISNKPVAKTKTVDRSKTWYHTRFHPKNWKIKKLNFKLYLLTKLLILIYFQFSHFYRGKAALHQTSEELIYFCLCSPYYCFVLLRCTKYPCKTISSSFWNCLHFDSSTNGHNIQVSLNKVLKRSLCKHI